MQNAPFFLETSPLLALFDSQEGGSLAGFLGILVALGLLVVLTEVFSNFLKDKTPPTEAVPRAQEASLPSLPPEEEALSPQLLAVIAAAVHVTLREPVRIHSIRPAQPYQGWAAEGRRQIFASHSIR